MKKNKTLKKLGTSFTLALSMAAGAHAAVPTTGAYLTDPQNEYVQDSSLERIQTVNMIMCFISKFRADSFVNQGEYLALVDEGKCQSDKSSGESTSSGASASVTYAKVFASTTRTSDSSPQTVVARLFIPEENGEITIFINATLTEGPSSTSPNGVFSLQFEGYASNDLNTKAFEGELSANGTTLTFFETDSFQNSTTRLVLSQDGTSDSGQGQIALTGAQTVNEAFAYNGTHFIRGTNASNSCFARDSDQADTSTWRYGVYNENGSRYELSNPGFPLKYTPSSGNFSGKEVWGFASFYGVYFPQDVFTALKADTNAQLIRPDTGVTYSLSSAGGKLTRLTRNDSTLSGIKGQPVRVFLNVGSSFSEVELEWDGTTLTKKREITFNQNGQSSTTATGSVSAADLRGQNQFTLFGYSSSLGGEVQIEVPTSGEFTGNSGVVYRTRELVSPAEADTLTLQCVNQCPAGGSALNSPSTVYQAVNGQPYNFAPVANGSEISYTFSGGVMQTGGSAVDASAANLQNSQFQFGVYSGNLFAASDAANASCGSDGTPNTSGDHVCPSLVGGLTTVYQYETGPNPWNQYIGLQQTGVANAVVFDPPKSFNLTVSPSNTTVTQGSPLDGSSVVLEYQGFGQLQGIPGTCVNPSNNEAGACDGTTFTRYVPQFSLKDGTELTDGTNLYYVKYLDREVRLKEVASTECSNQGLALPSALTLPTVSTIDARSAVGSIGASTNPPTEPSVVHGVIQ